MQLKHRSTALLLAVLLLLCAFVGCKQAAAPAPTAAPTLEPAVTAEPTAAPTADPSVTVTDMAGRTRTLAAPASRVVALTASDCEILYAIGAGETLVGRGTYCDYPAEVASVPEVASGADTNLEQILALSPEAVVMSTMAQTEAQVKALEDAGVAVIVSDAQNIAGVYTAIELLGKLTGHDAEAAEVIASMQKTFDGIREKTASAASGKTVYFEVSPLQWGLWTAGSGTFMDELAAMLGLQNAFPDVAGWNAISEEQVLTRDPDYIVTITMYYGEGPTPVEEIRSRAGWENLKAVQGNQILNADSNEISRPGPRLADAANTLYAFVYGK